MLTATITFSGIGLMDFAAAANFKVVQAVECDRGIARNYAHNFPEVKLFQDFIQNLDPREFVPTDYLHGSPSCKNARNFQAESPDDIRAALGFLAIAQSMHARSGGTLPRWVTVENVPGYFRGFDSFKLLKAGLEQLGFTSQVDLLEAASLGVPQRRLRGWARFSRTELKPIEVKGGTVGWYPAIAHLIDELPDVALANWQVERLGNKYGASWKQELRGNYYLIEKAGAANGSKQIQVIDAASPVFTLKSIGKSRHTQQMVLWLPDGTVKKVTPEALWYLQMHGCPQRFHWAEKTPETVKVVGIGNGVPYLMGRAIIESLGVENAST